MNAPIIDIEFWTLIEPLLPRPKPWRKGPPGLPRVSDRVALNGIQFVMKPRPVKEVRPHQPISNVPAAQRGL